MQCVAVCQILDSRGTVKGLTGPWTWHLAWTLITGPQARRHSTIELPAQQKAKST